MHNKMKMFVLFFGKACAKNFSGVSGEESNFYLKNYFTMLSGNVGSFFSFYKENSFRNRLEKRMLMVLKLKQKESHNCHLMHRR